MLPDVCLQTARGNARGVLDPCCRQRLPVRNSIFIRVHALGPDSKLAGEEPPGLVEVRQEVVGQDHAIIEVVAYERGDG